MKKILNVILGFAAYFTVAVVFMGYGHRETHPYLNEVIVLKFLDKVSAGSFTNKDKFKNFEFNWNNSDQPTLSGMACSEDALFYSTLADDVSENHTPMEWISIAGWMEDVPWAPASLCHFYDPQAIDGEKHINDCSGLLESVPILKQVKEYASIDALTWATTSPGHPFTWKVAKEYIIKALKESDPGLRKKHMALAYRCLGQVMHLVCDMGCTPHVRNDSHPPEMFYVIGDPDPYEDITKKLDVYLLWQMNPPDENFKNELGTMEKFNLIFDKMARFTNERFFSGQTIYTDLVKPVIRPDNPYPSPRVTNEDYNTKEYAYYKTYDGVTVKMCKDKVPIPFPIFFGNDSLRGRPYLDYECVKSIATALYPNIAEAGANVIRLFIPALKVEIFEAKVDSGGIIRGKVSYTVPSADDEYSGLFDLNNLYNGPVSLFINNSDTKITVEARKNIFEFKLAGKISNLKKEDGATVKLEFGGIVLKSDIKKFANTGPVITEIVPAKGKVGDELTIQGTFFGLDRTKGEVHFTDAIADQQSIMEWSENLIKVKVPDQATTGNLKVKVNQDFSNEVYFAVPPIITSLSKTSGMIGDQVTLEGSKFGSTASDGSVFFNGAPCTVIASWNDKKIEAKVPSNATSGDVTVRVKGEVSNKINFQILGPQITSIIPGSAKVGDEISINGTWFGSDQTKGEVFFNELKADEISSWTNTLISVKVPVGATSGNIVVRVNGVQSNQYYYNIAEAKLTITSITPNKGTPGDRITLAGKGFGDRQNASTVTFASNVLAAVVGWNNASIITIVPNGAVSGNVTVTVDKESASIYFERPRGRIIDQIKATNRIACYLSAFITWPVAEPIDLRMKGDSACYSLGWQNIVPLPGLVWSGNSFTAENTAPAVQYKITGTFSEDGFTLLVVNLKVTYTEPADGSEFRNEIGYTLTDIPFEKQDETYGNYRFNFLPDGNRSAHLTGFYNRKYIKGKLYEGNVKLQKSDCQGFGVSMSRKD